MALEPFAVGLGLGCIETGIVQGVAAFVLAGTVPLMAAD